MQQIKLVILLLILVAAKPKADLVLEGKYKSSYSYIPQNSGFFISKSEITNEEYRKFLNHLRAINDSETLQEAQVDSARWKNEFSYGELYENYYFKSAEYNKYPMVNISKSGAELYCQWLTETYNAIAKQKFLFRLPTEQEWLLAAQGGNSSAKYAWEGGSLTYEKKGKLFGRTLCNARISTTTSRTDTAKVNPSADITAPVISYLPNAYGLFNMCGNVAEMLSDKPFTKGGSWNSKSEKVQIAASEPYDGKPLATVGFRVVAIPLK